MLPSASAPVLLGLYAGGVAGLAVLPIALLALVLHWTSALGVAGDSAAALVQARAALHDVAAPQPRWPADVRALMHTADDGTWEVEIGDRALADAIRGAPQITALCATTGPPRLLQLGGARWAWACTTRGDVKYLIAVEPPLLDTGFVLALIFLLAGGVGLITALLIRRVLSPLTAMANGLARVTAGERDVRIAPTGLRELDDLVDRVNATAEAVEAREDEITGRIRTVQRLARIVAHEVRNPLQSVELLTSLLVDESDAAARAKTAEAIRNEIQLLDQVVTRMLNRSIGDDLELKLQPFDLAALLSHVYAIHAPRARQSGLTIGVAAPDHLRVVGDQALMGRCIENLLVNGLQHARSTLMISAETRLDRVILEIDDDGPGIDPMVAERIFEPNASQRAGGSGLGLALARAVVHAHGGRIEASRSPMGGARFRIDLPLRASPTPGPAAPRRAAGAVA
jgi:signal transduction histidine kinase